MRVFIDARLADHAGIGRYSTCILDALLDQANCPTLQILAPYAWIEPVKSARSAVIIRSRSDRYSLSELLELAVRLRISDCDLIHSLNYLRPPSPLPSIITVHDVMRLRLPEYCHSNTEFIRRFGVVRFVSMCSIALASLVANRSDMRHLDRYRSMPQSDRLWQENPGTDMPAPILKLHHLYLSRVMHKSVKHARAVITVSKFSKAELVDLFGLAPTKIHVIYPGISPAFFRVGDLQAVDQVRAKYTLPSRYMLHVGLKRRHKNLRILIQAFAIFAGLETDPPLLVLVGPQDEDARYLLALARSAGMSRNVVFLGWVPDLDLNLLVNGALAVVVPSVYEGFSFPVLEAMACGVLVVASNIPAHSEVAGDAALLVDPFDPQAWAAALKAVSVGESLQRKLRSRSEQRIRKFDWRTTASQILDLYSSIFSGSIKDLR